MNTPSPKFFCPRCHAAYATDQQYCGRCGADMQHVSGLAYAAKTEKMRQGSTGPQSAAKPQPSWRQDREQVDPTKATADMEVGWQPPIFERRADGKDDWLGRIVDARYRVREVIGRGGMGVVYKVEHQRMGKIAAMKVLHHELASDPEVAVRFRREAEAVSRLTHPNTVQVFDFGTARGALYLIMEYVRGTDLGTMVKRDGPIQFERAAPLFAQISSALAEAHALGVIHRDLKPENILVTRTHGGHDFVKVLDFGLAKLTEREELSEVTDRGSIVGTPYYMSPEQIRGEEVDARSDLYSLGALMYRVLTGEPPFTAKNPVGVLTKHLTAELVPPSACRPDLEIDQRIDLLIGRALAKDPASRYASANQLVTDLEAVYLELYGNLPSGGMPRLSLSAVFSSRSSEAAVPVAVLADDVDYGIESDARLRRSDIDSYERRLRRRRWISAAVMPILLLAAIATAGYFFFFRTQPPRTSESEPNNDIDHATLVVADSPITGYLGKRISRKLPDRDYFRIDGSPTSDSAMTVAVTPLPNIDFELVIYDLNGSLLVQRNEGGVGHPERIRNYRINRPFVVMIGETVAGDGRLPTENVSDNYTLTVSLAPPAAGVELEPNDSSSDATPLGSGAPVTGYLDRRQDQDMFRFDGNDGEYQLRISGAGIVPLEWHIGGGTPNRERSATITIRRGEMLTLRRTDREQPHEQQLPGVDEPYAILLTPVPG